MVKIGDAYIIENDAEMDAIIERGVVKYLEKINHIDPNEKLFKKDIMKELNIGQTIFQNKVLNGKYPLPLYGTPKKRHAIRSEFEAWRKSDWGRY